MKHKTPQRMIIYKIINLINNKIYIGQTKNIKKRWNKHKQCGKNNIYNQLYEDINEYKIINFTIEKIETVSSPNIANEREKYWIKKLNSQDPDIGYNIYNGGVIGDSLKNKKLSKEQKINISVGLNRIAIGKKKMKLKINDTNKDIINEIRKNLLFY